MEQHLIFDMEQGSLEWHEMRDKHLPASEVGAVMEVNPWSPKNQRELFAVRNGEMFIEENFAMERGTRLEPKARAWISNVLEIEFQPCIAVNGQYMASLDGLSRSLETILEIKCPMNYEKLRDAVEDSEIPDHYWFQMCQQAYCTPQAKEIVFCVYDGDNGSGCFRTMDAEPMRQEFIDDIMPAWQSFLSTNHEPLEIDMSDDEMWSAAAHTWWKAKKELADAKKEARISQLEKAEKEAKAALIEACEKGVKNVGHGISVTWSEVPEKTSNGYIMKRVTGSWED